MCFCNKIFCHGICGVYCLLALMWPANYTKIFLWLAMPATLGHPALDETKMKLFVLYSKQTKNRKQTMMSVY